MTRLERLWPLVGVVAVGAFVAEAIVMGDTPKADAPAAEVVAFLRGSTTKHEVAASLFTVAAVAFVWFGARLRAALRKDDDDRFGTVALVGAGVIAVGLAMYASFGLASAHAAGKVSASTLQTLNVLNRDDMYVPLAVGAALVLLATAAAVLRDAVLPRWTGWLSAALGLVATAAAVFGPFADGFGFLGFLTLLPWTLTLSVVMYRRQPGLTRL